MRADASGARLALITLLLPATAAAQGPTARPGEPSSIDWTVTADVVRDLPAANVPAILEMMQPELVADRFNSGGLAAGGASFIVAPLGSRTQSRYRIGDIDIGSPTSGEPLLFPELAYWQRIETTTGLMTPEAQAPSLAVALEPARPSAQWSAAIEGFVSGARLVSSGSANGPPPVARLDDWTHGVVLLGGPIGRRHGLTAGGSWSQAERLDRGHKTVRERTRSLFVQHAFTPARERELRTLGWLQSVRSPSPHATVLENATAGGTALHLQSVFQSSVTDRSDWGVFAGFTQRSRDQDPLSSERFIDRLTDGPVPALLGSSNSVERRWSAGARWSPRWLAGRHRTRFGLDLARATSTTDPRAASVIGEFLDGVPARVWSYSGTTLMSARRATSLSGVAEHRVALTPAAHLDAALAYEWVDGSAKGAADGIVWHTLLPRVALRWDLGTPAALALVSGYRRAANQLTLDLLAAGDPAAPVGQIFRWDAGATMAAPGPLVARVGPGTGGAASFSGIDASLKRPHADEFVIALESRPSPSAWLRVAGIARRQASLVSLVNVGVSADAYRVFLIPDANADLAGPGDDQLLPVYERRPESFGSDRYLLTNPDDEPATMGAVVITAQVSTARLFLFVGATASASVGPGASRGFRGIENDQDAIGERHVAANAATYARGRLFSDRAYMIKWTTVYRLPRDIRLGAIARYQDGQPFSRLVIVPGLAQGAEAIQAFANGRSRFAFTGTLDLRLQKGFAIGSRRLDAIVDVYNALDLHKEVEEYVVTGDRFRSTTLTQPPRAVHFGLRLSLGG